MPFYPRALSLSVLSLACPNAPQARAHRRRLWTTPPPRHSPSPPLFLRKTDAHGPPLATAATISAPVPSSRRISVSSPSPAAGTASASQPPSTYFGFQSPPSSFKLRPAVELPRPSLAVVSLLHADVDQTTKLKPSRKASQVLIKSRRWSSRSKPQLPRILTLHPSQVCLFLLLSSLAGITTWMCSLRKDGPSTGSPS